MIYKVLDEIVKIPESNPKKALYLQLLEFTGSEPRKEFRFCYYMLGHKPRGRGKWLFGQFAPMVSKEDFEEMICKARSKGWISC